MPQTPDCEDPEPPLRLLFVCTANRCRSPMAEAFARRTLERRGIDAEIVSAGRIGGGHEASEGAVDALHSLGLDLRNHRSSPLDPDTLAYADLILVMERAHLSDVFGQQPSAIDRAFTLGEFPGLLDAAAHQSSRTDDVADADVVDRIEQAHRLRDPARILAVDTSSDISDPMGRRFGAYRRTARDLERLIDRTVELLYPTATR